MIETLINEGKSEIDKSVKYNNSNNHITPLSLALSSPNYKEVVRISQNFLRILLIFSKKFSIDSIISKSWLFNQQS